jgi:hypothetical protein
MTALYLTTRGPQAVHWRKPTFQPRKTLPVDFLLPIPPVM